MDLDLPLESFDIEDITETFDSDFFGSAFGLPATFQDIETLLDEQKQLRKEFLTSLQPTERESQLKQELADIRSKAEFEEAGLALGLADIGAQPVSTRLITGRQTELQQQAAARVQALSARENTLLRELGLEQEARTAQQTGLSAMLGFTQQDVDLRFKIQDRLDDAKQTFFNNFVQLRGIAQNQLNTILEQMEGVSFESLDFEGQQKVARLSTQLGIPLTVIQQGLQIRKSEAELNALLKEADLLKKQQDLTKETPLEGDEARLWIDELIELNPCFRGRD